ncbi:MAG: hypothetical protein ACR2NZ_03070 [Rubripirellula sp.]
MIPRRVSVFRPREVLEFDLRRFVRHPLHFHGKIKGDLYFVTVPNCDLTMIRSCEAVDFGGTQAKEAVAGASG